MKHAVTLLFVMGLCSSPGSLTAEPPGRILQLAELNSASLAALDPARTAFILANGPLEAHGPHLPIAADTYQCEYAARRMADQLATSLPGWSIVLMPMLWYGVDGANTIPERYDVRGTISLRASTLRAIVADLGSQLADHGFRWVFVVHIHGAAHEHVAFSDAADFVSETRGIAMLNIGSMGYLDEDSAVTSLFASRFSEAERSRIAFDVHAGMWETSAMLAARPDLVSAEVRSLPDVTVHDWDELDQAGRRPTWRGYWSAPALADAGLGRRLLDGWADRWARYVLRAVRGEDLRGVPRYPGGQPDSANMRQAARSLSAQTRFETQLGEWLRKRRSMIDR